MQTASMTGRSVAEVAELLGQTPQDVGQLLAGAMDKRGLPKGAERVREACRAETGPPASRRPDRSAGLPNDVVSLTWREIETVHLLDGRYTNRELAHLLSITEEAVKRHTSSIYAKLRVTGRREAMADCPKGWA